ncbi:MAG TPA: radical SAM protein [Thermodesulfovibrionales bacterium]|nr:radical SAM protein [Thermodesulfovibrionales bacterium]
MNYFLSPRYQLKWLEFPSLYDMVKDELYELDDAAFQFLRRCADQDGCDGDEYGREFLDYVIEEGFLTSKPVNSRRPPIRRSADPSLRYLELQITRRCNLRCGHCYIGPSEDLELPLETILSVMTEFEGMQGLRLLITGGEPLLHRGFQSLNTALPGYAFRKILFTNGALLTEAIISSLNVDEIQVSIDGLEAGHDALRGKGTYTKAMHAITLGLNAGREVSVSTIVHAENLEDFDEMERLFRGIGVKDWTVDVPCLAGNLRDNPRFHLKPGTSGRYLRYGFGEGLHGGGDGFACGAHLASAMADGSVARCAFYSHRSVGHIKEGLDVCWKRLVPVRMEELACDCNLRDNCRGGCRYRAELLGDPYGKDLYRCVACDVSTGDTRRD